MENCNQPLIEQVKSFIEFLENSYTVIGMVCVGPSVCTIYVKEIDHPIQMIVTTNGTSAEILSSFDKSHNRRGIYRGHTCCAVSGIQSAQSPVQHHHWQLCCAQILDIRVDDYSGLLHSALELQL